MNDTEKRIEETEARAAECELIGRLATDMEVRTYNRRLAAQLREHVALLRAGILIKVENHLRVTAFETGSKHSEVTGDGRDEEKRESGAGV